jgi:hypothetical protein
MATDKVLDYPTGKKKPGRRKKQSASGGSDSGDDRPVIDIRGGNLPGCVDALERVLLEVSPEIFQSGGRLVAAGYPRSAKKPEADIHQVQAAPRLVALTAVHLREVATRKARFRRFDARAGEMRDVDCLLRVAQTLAIRGR